MKILHTSDWHLGHQLYGYDRKEEQLDMLNQITDIVATEKPDAFLLCGDVFHVSQPSASVQKMFVDAILSLRKAHPDMKVIVTAGNHDSGVRHEIFSTPWSLMGVETIGTLHQEKIEEHIIDVKGKGYVIALPYVNERYLQGDFFQSVLQRVASINKGGLPVIMMAHTTVRGADFTGHDRSDSTVVGGIEGIEVSQLGEGYDYLALGHIHHEQFVHTGRHNVRYCGTPLAVSFDETYEHSVSIVETNSHGDAPKVRKIKIENKRPLINLPLEGFTDWNHAKALLKNFPDDKEAYIRLNVEVENYLPNGAADEARQIVSSKACRFCVINDRRRRDQSGELKSMTVSEFKELDPTDLVQRYIEQKGGTFTQEIASMFREAVNQLNQGDET